MRYDIPTFEELSQFAQLIQPKSSVDIKPFSLSVEDYIARLDYHGITLLALKAERLPSDVAKALSQRKAMMVANDALKQRALIELFNAFANQGLTRSVLFKGSALAYSLYPQPWLRPRTDSDILIEQSDLAQFEQIFNKLGYQKLFAIEGKHISYQSTFSKHLAGKSAINIDLHWRINNRQILAQCFSVDQLLESNSQLNSLSKNINIPSTVDSLLIASLHRLGHHLNDERLTWLYDIHLIASDLSNDDWQAVIKKSEQKQLAAITLDALTLCHTLFATELDKNALVQLQTLSLNKEPSQLFLQRDLPEWRYFWHDLSAMESLTEKLRLIMENVIPSPAYVRQQMNTKSALAGYIKRLFRGLKRIF